LRNTGLALTAVAVCCALGLPSPAAAQVKEKIVYAFAGPSAGLSPQASLIAVNGTLYGTTYAGGSNGIGTVFSLDPRTGVETVLVNFGRDLDGAEPKSGLVAVKGILYCTTTAGGTNSEGTAFSLDPTTGVAKLLHAFGFAPDDAEGAQPLAGLIAVKGALYGTTYFGGGCNSTGCGTVFSLDPATGAETIPFAFCRLQNCTAGAYPSAGLIDIHGLLYGTASQGGAYGYGTLFSLDPKTGAVAALHAFGGGTDGEVPSASVIAVNGILYGTTPYGGGTSQTCKGYGFGAGCGIVFALDPESGVETVLHAFDGADGEYSYAGLVAVNGTLYGTTSHGGAYGEGTVFSVDEASGAFATVHSFGNGTDGANPYAALIDVKGTLYGTTANGGAHGYGTVYSLKNF
jgi:uncharacterized repeat protein (TIGR03803 family)